MQVSREKLKQKYGSEEVLVIFNENIKHIPDKYHPDCAKIHYSLTKFMLRYDAEYSLTHTQLIPYVVVTNSTGDKLYVTERLGGEERLRSNLSLGASGHINPIDMSKDIIKTAAFRELNEELSVTFKGETELKRLGTVRDLNSSTPDHIGFVYLARASRVSVKEKQNLRGKWMDRIQLMLNYERFESWAKLFINYLIMSTPEGVPFFSDKIHVMPKRRRGSNGRNS